MSVDLAAVQRIAKLARVSVSDEETQFLREELNATLAFVEQLAEVDIDGVEPMASVARLKLPMRDDVVRDGAIATKILANAPVAEDGFFLVPKVIE